MLTVFRLSFLLVFNPIVLLSFNEQTDPVFHSNATVVHEADSMPTRLKDHFFLQSKYGMGSSVLDWNEGTSSQRLLKSVFLYSSGINIIYYPSLGNLANFSAGIGLNYNKLLIRDDRGELHLKQLVCDLNYNVGNYFGFGIDTKFDLNSKLKGSSPIYGYSTNQVKFANFIIAPKVYFGYAYKQFAIRASLSHDLKAVFLEDDAGFDGMGQNPSTSPITYTQTGWLLSLLYTID